jgi:hypothetical protein
VGFRTGPYSALPWVLAGVASGREVMMIVSYDALAGLAGRLGRTFMPSTNKRVTFVSSQDPRVLPRALAVLREGGIVATLLEGSPITFNRKAPVSFLGWTIDVPYGLSYLSSVTGRPYCRLPSLSSRCKVALKIGDPIPAPPRNPEAIPGQAQLLYAQLGTTFAAFPTNGR